MKSDRALERKSACESGNNPSPDEIISECYGCAVQEGATIFAIQNGVNCWVGNGDEYKKHGPSTECSPDGTGGKDISNVYRVKGETSITINRMAYAPFKCSSL